MILPPSSYTVYKVRLDLSLGHAVYRRLTTVNIKFKLKLNSTCRRNKWCNCACISATHGSKSIESSPKKLMKGTKTP